MNPIEFKKGDLLKIVRTGNYHDIVYTEGEIWIATGRKSHSMNIAYAIPRDNPKGKEVMLYVNSPISYELEAVLHTESVINDSYEVF